MKKIGLFCYIGDTIYWCQGLKYGKKTKISPLIRKSVVTEIQIKKNDIFYHCDGDKSVRHTFSNRGFKNNWFLNESEAEEYREKEFAE